MLVTFEDMQAVRPIANNIDRARVMPYIAETEELVIIPLLPGGLYENLIADPDSEENKFLLDGGNRNDTRLVGLKKAIAYIAYSRFIVNNQLNATPLGVRLKDSPLSTDVSDNVLFRVANQAEATGKVFLQQVVDYLKTNGCEPEKRVAKSKFKVIGI